MVTLESWETLSRTWKSKAQVWMNSYRNIQQQLDVQERKKISRGYFRLLDPGHTCGYQQVILGALPRKRVVVPVGLANLSRGAHVVPSTPLKNTSWSRGFSRNLCVLVGWENVKLSMTRKEHPVLDHAPARLVPCLLNSIRSPGFLSSPLKKVSITF